VVTSDLVATQQDYTLPASEKILKVKRVEVQYTTNGQWFKAEPLDIAERSSATDTTTLAQDFVKTAPFYDLAYNAVWLYPIPDSAVTGGLKLWVMREIDEFVTSDTTQEPGIDEPFHRLISLGASLDWAVAKGLSNKNDIAAQVGDLESRMIRHYTTKNADRRFVFDSVYSSSYGK